MFSFTKLTAGVVCAAVISTVGISASPAMAAEQASISSVVTTQATEVPGSHINVQYSQQVIDVFNGINAYRATKGLKALTFNATVADQSSDWSNEMAKTGVVDHNPELGYDSRTIGRSTNNAEVVAGRADLRGQGLVEQWIGSPAHNGAISDPDLDSMGVGISTNGTMMYGTVNMYKFVTAPAGQYANPTSYFNGEKPLDPPPTVNVTAIAPVFNKATGTYTIPQLTGVDYTVNGVLKPAGTYDSGWAQTNIIATAQDGYKVFGALSWMELFTRTVVTPIAPTFDLANRTYTIPTGTRVSYFVNGVAKATGTYASGNSKITITAKENPGYVINGTASWNHDFTLISVSAPVPVFNTTAKTYTIPSVAGIDYKVNGVSKPAGSYTAADGTLTVTASAKAGYVLSGDASWSATYTTTLVKVTPQAPGFNGSTGKYVIPYQTGVKFYVAGVFKGAGTYDSGWKAVAITAKANPGYTLSGTSSWNYTFVQPANPSIKSKADLVAIDPSGNLWNYGKSNSARVKIGAGWKGMNDIHVIDWNVDGYVDILAKTTGGDVYFYKGNKYGGFTRSTIGRGWQGYSISVAKWKTTDKYPSVIAKQNSTGALYQYPNTGNSALSSRKLIGTGWGQYAITTFDWDKDGRMDIVARNAKGELKLYRTDGAGRFKSETRKTIGAGWNGFNILKTVDTYGGAGTNGLLVRDSRGTLYYYQANKGSWSARKTIGAGWGGYVVAGH